MTATTRTPFNWRLFLTLWLAGTIAVLPLIPVTVVLGESGVAAHRLSWQTATETVLLAAIVIFSAAIYVGLRSGARVGLGAPLTEAWLAGKPAVDAAARLVRGAGAGGALGLVGVIVAMAIAGGTVSPAMPGDDVVPLWVGVAQATSAGVGEELLFRLGLMSLMVAFVWRALPSGDESPSNTVMWIALALTAALFTMVHGAPAGEVGGAGQLVTEPMQLVRLLGGGLFGWLFWKQGLEAAMAAHFAYDMVLFYGIIAVL